MEAAGLEEGRGKETRRHESRRPHPRVWRRRLRVSSRLLPPGIQSRGRWRGPHSAAKESSMSRNLIVPLIAHLVVLIGLAGLGVTTVAAAASPDTIAAPVAAASSTSAGSAVRPSTSPPTPRRPVKDTYHGVEVNAV